MKSLTLRSFAIDINWGRLALAFALILGFGLLLVEPAYAFDQFESKVTQQTQNAARVAKNVLLVAAILSLLIGLAPMLWGQVKVKWIVTALCACVLFGLAGVMVDAFKA